MSRKKTWNRTYSEWEFEVSRNRKWISVKKELPDTNRDVDVIACEDVGDGSLRECLSNYRNDYGWAFPSGVNVLYWRECKATVVSSRCQKFLEKILDQIPKEFHEYVGFDTEYISDPKEAASLLCGAAGKVRNLKSAIRRFENRIKRETKKEKP